LGHTGQNLSPLNIGLGRDNRLFGTDHAKERDANRILHGEARQTFLSARTDDAGFRLVNRGAAKSEVERLPREEAARCASPDCL
jgi:hypothetical protein